MPVTNVSTGQYGCIRLRPLLGKLGCTIRMGPVDFQRGCFSGSPLHGSFYHVRRLERFPRKCHYTNGLPACHKPGAHPLPQ